MAEYLVQDTSLTAVADAIRAKTGSADSLAFPSGMVEAISGFTGGEDLDAELATQDELIDQIVSAIENKSAGGGGSSGGGLLIDWGVSGGAFDGEAYSGVYTETGSMVLG